MTDTSKYTGAHKLRFDESGKGRGLEGRDSTPKGPGNRPHLVSEQVSYVTGNLIGLDAVDSERAKDSHMAKTKAAAAARSSPRPSGTKTTPKSSPRVHSVSKSTAATNSPKSSTKTKTKVIP